MLREEKEKINIELTKERNYDETPHINLKENIKNNFKRIDDGLYNVECHACGMTICITEEMYCEGEMDCPSCGAHLEFEID